MGASEKGNLIMGKLVIRQRNVFVICQTFTIFLATHTGNHW
jgi:ribosomal protein L36